VSGLKLGDYEAADSHFKRARGIMFRRSLGKPMLFVFPVKGTLSNAIHSFFCLVRFDAVFLDEKKQVVDVRERIMPFLPLIVPRKPAKYLIEAPAGWARKKKVAVGDTITF